MIARLMLFAGALVALGSSTVHAQGKGLVTQKALSLEMAQAIVQGPSNDVELTASVSVSRSLTAAACSRPLCATKVTARIPST